MTACNI